MTCPPHVLGIYLVNFGNFGKFIFRSLLSPPIKNLLPPTLYLDLQECISPSHPLAPVKKAYFQGHHLPFNIGEGHLAYRHRDFQDILRVKGWVMLCPAGLGLGISTTNFCLFRATRNELEMMFITQN